MHNLQSFVFWKNSGRWSCVMRQVVVAGKNENKISMKPVAEPARGARKE